MVFSVGELVVSVSPVFLVVVIFGKNLGKNFCEIDAGESEIYSVSI